MAALSGRRPLENAMAKILQGLNSAQKAAVTSSAPVLQVLAPPGSGKTKTLTSRVAYLLTHEQYAPWNVICCTFTIKASREMRERLRGMIGEELESKLILGTFHSVCRRYLVTYGHLIGIPKNFGVADSDDSLSIIKRAVKRLKLSIDPKSARSRISHRKARGKRLEDLPKVSQKNVEAQEFATIFQEYEDALALSNLLDYDDLLMKCVDLLKRHPECVSNIEALLIDEFQDTNVVQFELMKLLASAKKRVTIVGDPDQSIYGFRSAEIENLTRMKAFYPDTVVINLEENYRSATAVLKLAQEVIEQDNDRPQKKLKSTHCYGTLPVLRRLPNPHEEAQWVVSEIKRMTAMTGSLLHHGDIAILLRSAFLSLLIEKALANHGIPYRMVGGRRFFDRVEVRILLDYLRTVSHPDNTSALLSIINTPTRKIGDTTIKELTRVAELRKESVWSISQKVLQGQIVLDKALAKPATEGLKSLVSVIQRARSKMESMKPVDAPGKLIELVISSLKYQDYLKKQYPEDHEERWENVKELVTQATDASLHFNAPDEKLPAIDGIVQEAANGAQEVLARFLANVVLSTEVESDDPEQQKPRITISTIHSAKGLEWPVVFVPAVYEGSIPHSRAEDTNEERRLLYVAMTRAQALLYLTFPTLQSRDQSESILSQFLPNQINPFVANLGPDFNDRAIEELASILRRELPSQEAIAKGHCNLKEHESQSDDIWPEDGSHKRSFLSSNQDPVRFVLEKGQSLSDALKTNPSHGQRSYYSTFAASSTMASTTMTNIADFSTSNMTLGFTTANQHMKTAPGPAITQTSVRTLINSISAPTDDRVKRPRLTKSASMQGSIATFFRGGNRPKLDTSAVLDQSITQPILDGSTILQPTAPNKKTIPSTLPNHKLAYGTSLLGPRSRTTLHEVGGNRATCGEKRGYGFLSSSPTREKHTDYPLAASHNYQAHEQERDIQTSARKGLTMSSALSAADTIALQGSKTLLSQDNPFRLGPLDRLGGLGPLNNVQPTTNFMQPTVLRKTLGVRRSMNGWADRKNK